MSSKRRQRRKSCEGKQRHDTKTAAIGQKTSLIKNGLANGRLNVYKCSFCGGWHVGHSRGQLSRRIREKRVME